MGEIARGLEPIPLFTDTGCRMGHYAARKQTPPPFRPPIHMDYSGRDAPWRRCFCGDGEPWDCGGAGCARRVGALRLHGEPAPTHLHRHAGRASSQVLARWAGVFSGLLLTPLAARPTALSRPRRAGLLLAL